jgi:methylaspartate ammonia-lyase
VPEFSNFVVFGAAPVVSSSWTLLWVRNLREDVTGDDVKRLFPAAHGVERVVDENAIDKRAVDYRIRVASTEASQVLECSGILMSQILCEGVLGWW